MSHTRVIAKVGEVLCGHAVSILLIWHSAVREKDLHDRSMAVGSRKVQRS